MQCINMLDVFNFHNINTAHFKDHVSAFSLVLYFSTVFVWISVAVAQFSIVS